MNIALIEENVKALLTDLTEGRVEQGAFIYELLLAYGHRKQSVSRLRSGERNLALKKTASKNNEPQHNEILWKRHLYFKQVEGGTLHAEIDQMRKEKLVTTNKIRFVIVTNFDQLLAVDTKTADTLDIQFEELAKQFDFFLPWAGMEKAVYQGENPADVKAAEKMAKLFDLIKGDNFDESNKDDTEALHNLNVFLTRLLFCFFAEDTEIFADNQFSHAIESHTKEDGGDLSNYLNRLFSVLNTADADRGELPDYLASFPYVNGGLFGDDIPSPVFSTKSRRMLIECGSELDWSDINPDIFGSMIQAVVHPDQRGGMGMHYTSVTNIMKVIEPLFLNDLYEELEKVESSATKLQKLQQRLGEIKIFDPACGSGNFLIIAYKELRKLEMEVLKRLQEIELEKTGQISQPFSVIKLSQFYGIELDDFAHEVAILSLWLAEHQMNVEFKAEFGDCSPSLPLQKSGNIICGNSALMRWDEVCDPDGSEVFIMGNPPYLGARNQSKGQKEDMRQVFKGVKSVNSLDYISCWIYKASSFISENGGASGFVSTNSVVQGEHVPLLWPHVLKGGVEIAFAEESFKWTNSAKNKAAVICVVIGLSRKPIKKLLIKDGYSHSVRNISPYLTDNDTIFIDKRSKPLSRIPKMEYGNQPIEGGFLKLETKEKEELLNTNPEASRFIKRLIGGGEFLKGQERWCIWIEDDELDGALAIPAIKLRVEQVRDFRENGGEVARSLVDRCHQFRYRHRANKSMVLMPCTSSERRKYIPAGLFSGDYITLHSVQALYDPEPYVFGLISSRMHMVWTMATSGRLKSDIRYSSALTYNNFPIPNLSEEQKESIFSASIAVLSSREEYPDSSISKLYDPERMPIDLLTAHRKLDLVVEKIYAKSNFNNDSERLACLIKLYEEMTGVQSA